MAWALVAAVGPVFGSFVVAILEDRQLMSGVGARLIKGLAWPVEIRRQRRALSGLCKRVAVMRPRSRSTGTGPARSAVAVLSNGILGDFSLRFTEV